THSEYLADCILNGLVVEEGFQNIDGVGIINNQNHSVRNIVAYPRYKDDVIELNKVLASLKK
ncbi:Imm19 family immunity protein, partial [Bacillus sp. SIMBA_005]|uniref:Imm19 family immunity protein n=1 Tax=Bacillus sp. SIMBA_005 TaxID=3085754 RepID=UPI003978D07B